MHHSIIHIKNPTRCNSVSKFISYLYEINFDTLLHLVGFFYMNFRSYFLYFWLPDDSFSQKPKDLVSNGPDISVVVSNGWYCVFVHHVPCHNGMSSVETLSCTKILYGRWQMSEMCVGVCGGGGGWWNAVDRGEAKYSEWNLPYYHFVRHKSHMDWHGMESGPPRWKAGD